LLEEIRQKLSEGENELKKRLLFVIPTLRMGGAERSIVALLKSLDEEKVEADLFLFEGGGVLQKEVPAWVNIIESDIVSRAMILELRYYLKDLFKSGHIFLGVFRFLLTVRARISKRKYFNWKNIKNYFQNVKGHYDVAIGYLEGNTDFFVIDKVDADKKIGWIHTDMSKRKILLEEIEYYKKFDQLVTISEACEQSFVQIIPEISDKIKVIENIVIPEEIYQKAEEFEIQKDDTRRIQIVSIGRLEYEKGIDIAARAAKILADRNVQFCWHIYGEGTMEKDIQHIIDENGLGDCFVLEGQKNNPYPYMKMADILVQPSRNEGKSIVLDEAKILGKAIVVTKYSSVFDQIVDNETGIIVDISAEGIAGGIEKLIADDDLRSKIECNSEKEINDSVKTVDKFYDIIL